MNHTPGPWHLTETEPGIDADMDVFTMAPRYAGGTALVARVMHADDALVIAAAPELLAALESLVSACENEGFPHLGNILPAARRAISKSLGE